MDRKELMGRYAKGDRGFSRSDLRGANLRWADLSGADLRGANLRGANLRGAIGNNREILTIQTGIYVVVIDTVNSVAAIGCQQKPISEWLEITKEAVEELDEDKAAKAFEAIQWLRPLFEKYAQTKSIALPSE